MEFHSFAEAEIGTQDYRGYFYFLTNERSKNMQLYRVPLLPLNEYDSKFGGAGMDLQWVQEHKETVVEHRDFVLIEAF